MSIGLKILIFNAVEFFAALNNTCISDRTIALLLLVAYCQTSTFRFSKLWYVTARLLCRLIYNLPELSIRIFNPITSYFLINRYEYRIKNPDIQCCRIFRCAQQHVHIRQNNSIVASCGLLSNINL